MFERVLVVASHPDDEILGCGGTVARLAFRGSHIKTVIMSTGVTSRPENNNAQSISQLKESSCKANKILGVSNIEFMDLPDNKMDSMPLLEIIQKVEGSFINFNPSLVLTHFSGDLNIDHVITAKTVTTVFRPLPNIPRPTILYFETASSTDWTIDDHFKPNIHINITEFIDKKKSALECYHSEMREFPHSRSIKNIIHLASTRGSSVGFNVAESFMLGRMVL